MDAVHITDDWSDVFENVDDFYDPKDSSSVGNDTEDVGMETMYKRGSAMKGHKSVCPVNDLGFSDSSKHSALSEECNECCESLIDKALDDFGLEFML